MADTTPTQNLGSNHGLRHLGIAAGAALFALVSLFLVYLAFRDSWEPALLSLALLASASQLIWGEANKWRTGSWPSADLMFDAALAMAVLSSTAQAVGPGRTAG